MTTNEIKNDSLEEIEKVNMPILRNKKVLYDLLCTTLTIKSTHMRFKGYSEEQIEDAIRPYVELLKKLL